MILIEVEQVQQVFFFFRHFFTRRVSIARSLTA